MTRRGFDPKEALEAIARGELTCGDLSMRVDRDGNWFYLGSRIERKELVRLFAGVLHRAADGGYWLVTPVERGRIEVEDVPFTAVELESEGEGEARRVRLRTNIDEWLPLSDRHPLAMRATAAGATPYLAIRDGLEARLLPSLFYHLVELGEPAPDDPARFGVWSHGRFFTLGQLAEVADEP